MVHEIALAEFVLNELVGRAAVRYPKQRFRQHHQRQPLFGGEREFAKHILDAAEAAVARANRLDQVACRAIDLGVLLGRELRALEQPGRHDAIIGRIGCIKGREG